MIGFNIKNLKGFDYNLKRKIDDDSETKDYNEPFLSEP